MRDANIIISGYLTFFADFVITGEKKEDGETSSINRMKTGACLTEVGNHCLFNWIFGFNYYYIDLYQ